MRRKLLIPRILKINWIRDLTISVTFNNGESRVIDFMHTLKILGVSKKDPEYILNQTNEFSKVELKGNTLSWGNVMLQVTQLSGEKERVPFEMGADILYKYSKPENSKLVQRVGRLIKESRLKSGMTQQDLAIKSGTTRTYISRIENERSDIELGTLRKIIEIGLGKKLEIQII